METTTVLDIQETAGNPLVTLDPLQRALEPYADAIIMFWILVWVATALVLLYKLRAEYLLHKQSK